MSLILDTGALIAIERGNRALVRRLSDQLAAGDVPRTNGGVVAQVWRGGRGRQALLASALDGITVENIDAELGRRAGNLLGAARRSDAIDASVVAMARDGDIIVTSDVDDIEALIAASGRAIATILV